MKKNQLEMKSPEDEDLLPEYDFSGGIRGKHYQSMRSGYTVTIHQQDGTTLVQEVKPREGTVVLEPDVREYFPDSESVNRTLRSLILLIPEMTEMKDKEEISAGPRKSRGPAPSRERAPKSSR